MAEPREEFRVQLYGHDGVTPIRIESTDEGEIRTKSIRELTSDDLYIVLSQILGAINQPPDYNEAVNARNVSVIGTVPTTLSSGTLTNQTNIGGFSADMMTEDSSIQSWSIQRALYI